MLPRSGECRSVAEDTERRLVITESACLDKFVVDTDRLSASGEKIRQMDVIRKRRMLGGDHALLKGYTDLCCWCVVNMLLKGKTVQNELVLNGTKAV